MRQLYQSSKDKRNGNIATIAFALLAGSTIALSTCYSPKRIAAPETACKYNTIPKITIFQGNETNGYQTVLYYCRSTGIKKSE